MKNQTWDSNVEKPGSENRCWPTLRSVFLAIEEQRTPEKVGNLHVICSSCTVHVRFTYGSWMVFAHFMCTHNGSERIWQCLLSRTLHEVGHNLLDIAAYLTLCHTVAYSRGGERNLNPRTIVLKKKGPQSTTIVHTGNGQKVICFICFIYQAEDALLGMHVFGRIAETSVWCRSDKMHQGSLHSFSGNPPVWVRFDLVANDLL